MPGTDAPTRRLAGWLSNIVPFSNRPQRRSRIDTPEEDDSPPCVFCGGVRNAIVGITKRAEALWKAPQLDDGTTTRVRTFRPRSYPGSRSRRYEIYVPRGYTGRSAVPLVMVLHGCRQTHADIRAVSAFNVLAEKAGFIVLYPFVTNYADIRIDNCWGWWRAEEIRPGAGEVEDLWQIVEEVRSDINVDPNRVHVTGLSSGAGMAVAAMVVHCDKIASGGVVAGVAYAETVRAVSRSLNSPGKFRPVAEISRKMDGAMGDSKRLSPIFIVHSHDDPVVHVQAAENLRESWADCFGIDTSRRVSIRTGNTNGTTWEHKRYYGSRRKSAIETFYLEGVGHGWYGGESGKFSYPGAPNISEHIWNFLRRHPI